MRGTRPRRAAGPQVSKNRPVRAPRLEASFNPEPSMTLQPLAQALHIVGIELRTSNPMAFETIPAHWQRFAQENVLARIDGRLSDEVYAVYTHFEHAGRDNSGLYSLIVGAAVAPEADPPPGMVRAVVPASPRAVFPVEAGRFDRVGAAWQGIWQRRDLRKSYIADYERYGAGGAIEISVGLSEP